MLEKEDEMECLVSGCNFFLKAIRHEAFAFENGLPSYIASNGNDDVIHKLTPAGVYSARPLCQNQVHMDLTWTLPLKF